MKQCLILVLIFAISAANAVPHRSFRKKPHNGRIVGGEEVSIEDFPHQVSLHYSFGYFTCGGSIIGKNYVLTAGHCVTYLDDGYVRAGANETGYGGTEHQIVRVIRHKNFVDLPHALINDIAILKVEPAFEYGPSVAPVRLHDSTSNYVLEEGEMSCVTGFGSTESGGDLSDGLMAIYVPVIGHESCSLLYEEVNWDEIREDRFCAGFLEGGKDSCQGDSGGPVLVDGYQVGITSYGFGCARPKLPGIYTNVLHFLSWIEENTNENNV